ncbi:transcription factor myb3r-5 [Fagus crenata]
MVLAFQGSNSVVETEGVGDRGSSASPGIANDPVSEGMYEAKQVDLDMTNDNVKDGAIKAAEMADTVGDTAKQTLDGRWKAAQDTTKKIKDTA